jgi:hypothetical protein
MIELLEILFQQQNQDGQSIIFWSRGFSTANLLDQNFDH